MGNTAAGDTCAKRSQEGDSDGRGENYLYKIEVAVNMKMS